MGIICPKILTIIMSPISLYMKVYVNNIDLSTTCCDIFHNNNKIFSPTKSCVLFITALNIKRYVYFGLKTQKAIMAYLEKRANQLYDYTLWSSRIIDR
jgi:hypothetical protein